MHYDEIEHYIEMTTLMAPDAVGRILHIPYYGKSHRVVTLPVHLLDEQVVIFEEGDEEDALDRNERTMLTAFFELCAASPAPLQLLYSDVVGPYSWVHKTREWVKKKNPTEAIGRLQVANPHCSADRFYVRLLLLNRKCPTSFSDLKTIHGREYDTYKEACIALGLLEDDEAYRLCLGEMSNILRSYQLRRLFARMLLYCDVTNPVQLWNDFKSYLCADYDYVLSLPDRPAMVSSERLALAAISKTLEDCGKTLADYGLSLEQDVDELLRMADGLRDGRFDDGILEEVPDEPEEVDILLQSLNAEQRFLLDAVLDRLSNVSATGNLFYVDGPGGSGKTYAYNAIARKARLMGKNVLACAYTGLAASLLLGGRTSHNVFGIPVKDLDQDSSSTLRLQSPAARRLLDSHLILWDEISMTSRLQLQVVDHLLRTLMGTPSTPMGGKVVVFGGDFRQMLPIPPSRGGRLAVVSNTVLTHDIWQYVQKFTLSTNMRAISATEDFRNWLLNIGRGMPTVLSTGLLTVLPYVTVPSELPVKTEADLVQFTFGDFKETSNKAILTLTNATAQRINHYIIERLPGQMREYLSTTTFTYNGNREDSVDFQLEFIQSLHLSSLPPHALNLKVGCRVMLLRNIGIGSGLVNGTLMEVLRFYDHSIKVKILNGVRAGQNEYLFKVKLSAEHYPVTVSRMQYPIKVAFAMTVNKSQGQSFDRVGVLLDRDAFSHGQIYVAFSRSKRREDLRVCVPLPPGTRRPQGPLKDLKIRNVVYPEVLGREHLLQFAAPAIDPQPFRRL